MTKNPALKSLSITGMNIVARVFHLLVFLLIGNLYGVGQETDLVFLIYAPLVVIMGVVAGAAEITIMPGVHRAEVQGCVTGFLRAILKRGLIFVALATLLVVGASVLLNADTIAHPGVLLLLLPIPLLSCISAFSANVLNSHDMFRRAVLGPMFGASGAMVVLLSAPRTPIMLAFTLLAYEACSTLGLWAMARQFLLGPRDSQPGVISELTKTAMSGARMQMLGSLLAALNPLICILFARTLEPGSVTMVEYAGRLWNMVPLLFSGSLMLFYSQRSRAESRQQPGKTATHAVARNLGLVALAFSIVAIAFSRDIIDLIYGFGKMDEGERSVLAGLFSMYLLGAGAYVAGLVYVRSISAMRKVHIIALAAGLGVVLIIPLNLVMIRYFALEGIGVASSMASIAVALFLYRAYTYQSAKPAGKR